MPDTYHLLKRKSGVWYYNRRVPELFVSILKKKFIKHSLKTTSYNKARKLRNVKDHEWDGKFAILELDLAEPLFEASSVTYSEAVQKLELYFSHQYQKVEQEMFSDPPNQQQLDERRKETGVWMATFQKPVTEESQFYVWQTYKKLFGGRDEVFVGGKPMADNVFDQIRRGQLEYHKREMRLLVSDSTNADLGAFFPSSSATGADETLNGTPFQEICSDFLVNYDKEAVGKKLDKKTIEAMHTNVATAVEIIGGDFLTEKIDFDACTRFRDLIHEIPTNRKKIYGHLSIEEAIAKAKADGKPTLTHTTQTTYLSVFRRVLDFAVKKGALTTNPAAGLSSLATAVHASEKRRPFSIDELSKIFSAGVFASSLQEYSDPSKGDPLAKETKYFVPLIALYSGMRANEICQLHVEDVQRSSEGIWFIDVNENSKDKKLKNVQSTRVIPIHTELLQVGMIEFLKLRRKQKSERLFPELRLDKNGSYYRRPSRWFTEDHLSSYIKKEKGQGLHSFRHNFKDQMEVAEITDSIQARLGGCGTP